MATATPRERSGWGWGSADAAFTAAQAREAAPGIVAALGFGTTDVEDPVAVADVTLPAPRLAVPGGRPGCGRPATLRARRTRTGSPTSTSCGTLRGTFEHVPDLVARPVDEREVEEVLAWAQAAGAAVVPYGGGTSVVGGVEPRVPGRFAGAVSLDLGALDALHEVDPVSRAARIGAGASGPRLEAQLAEHGLTLRFYPQSFELSTLGGWVATRAGGHFATRLTHVDDVVEAVRAITPTGTWASRRLPGSGAGPSPDRLLLGSEGTLGVITEAWVRVQPRPSHRAARTVRFPGFAEGAEGVRAVVQSGLLPANLRLLDPLEAQAHPPRRGRARGAGPRVRVHRPPGRPRARARPGAVRGARRRRRAPPRAGGAAAAGAAVRRAQRQGALELVVDRVVGGLEPEDQHRALALAGARGGQILRLQRVEGAAGRPAAGRSGRPPARPPRALGEAREAHGAPGPVRGRGCTRHPRLRDDPERPFGAQQHLGPGDGPAPRAGQAPRGPRPVGRDRLTARRRRRRASAAWRSARPRAWPPSRRASRARTTAGRTAGSARARPELRLEPRAAGPGPDPRRPRDGVDLVQRVERAEVERHGPGEAPGHARLDAADDARATAVGHHRAAPRRPAPRRGPPRPPRSSTGRATRSGTRSKVPRSVRTTSRKDCPCAWAARGVVGRPQTGAAARAG